MLRQEKEDSRTVSHEVGRGVRRALTYQTSAPMLQRKTEAAAMQEGTQEGHRRPLAGHMLSTFLRTHQHQRKYRTGLVQRLPACFRARSMAAFSQAPRRARCSFSR